MRAGVRDGLCPGLRDELRAVVLLPAGVQLHRGAGVGDPPVGLLHDRIDGGPGGHHRDELGEAGGEDRRDQPLVPASLGLEALARPRGAVAPRGRFAAPFAPEGFVGNRIADSGPIRTMTNAWAG